MTTRTVLPCGTEAAYFRHRLNGEEPCPEDRKAAADARRTRARAKGQKPFKPARHATNSKYVLGCRCVPCKTAHTEYQAEWRNGTSRPRKRSTSIAECVLDVLTTFYPEAFTTETLIERVVGLHPEWNPKSVHRVLFRNVRNLPDVGVEQVFKSLLWRSEVAPWE